MFALIDATEMGTATDNIRVFQKIVVVMLRPSKGCGLSVESLVSQNEFLFRILDFFGSKAPKKSCRGLLILNCRIKICRAFSRKKNIEI